jgi:uncharacterized RDD family membrane protein YckC
LSTLVSQPVPQPAWKEEVNRRLEEHKNRRGLSIAPKSSPGATPTSVSDRAARAAARVAARYAKAPSYSDQQTAEARAALRAAEVATRAALEAQVAAQLALDNLDSEPETSSEPEEFVTSQSVAVTPSERPKITSTAPVESPVAAPPADSFAIRWDADLPSQSPATSIHLGHGESSDTPDGDGFASATRQQAPIFEADLETVEPMQPIYANLIHFPRELIATRRMRPRLSGVPQSAAEEEYGQLSIFEVDPSSISTQPEASVAGPASSASAFSGAEWSSIQLDAEPEQPVASKPKTAPVPVAASAVHLAPFERRLIAFVVDLALTLALFSACALGMARHLDHAMPLRSAEVQGAFAFLFIAVLYQAFFLLTTHTTPGMMYAGIALCTFDDEHPTRIQLRARLVAMLISVVPVGLGIAWAIFDEDHLSWHDRLSRTYMRKC